MNSNGKTTPRPTEPGEALMSRDRRSHFDLPPARSVAANPTQEQLRAWTVEYMPRVTVTEYGNVNYQASMKARQAP